MKRSAGFTLIEVVCVSVILVVLSATITPVYMQSQKSSLVSASMGKMRQWHLAIILYAEDEVGNAEFERLPSDLMAVANKSGFPPAMFGTGGRPLPTMTRGLYTYMVPSANADQSSWKDHLLKTQGNPVLLVDDSHNDSPNVKSDFFSLKLGLGIFYDGHLEKKRSTKQFGTHSTWEEYVK